MFPCIFCPSRRRGTETGRGIFVFRRILSTRFLINYSFLFIDYISCPIYNPSMSFSVRIGLLPFASGMASGNAPFARHTTASHNKRFSMAGVFLKIKYHGRGDTIIPCLTDRCCRIDLHRERKFASERGFTQGSSTTRRRNTACTTSYLEGSIQRSQIVGRYGIHRYPSSPRPPACPSCIILLFQKYDMNCEQLIAM
jgi:hypothetical protein